MAAKKKETIVTTGEMREFGTGAHRDCADDKGRCDLLPLISLTILEHEQKKVCHKVSVFDNLRCFTTSGIVNFLADAILAFCDEQKMDVNTALLEVSYHYKAGAEKYGANNWKKGMPCHVYLDSAIRHYLKCRRGDNDERHDRAFIWNILCLIWQISHDMSDAISKEEKYVCDCCEEGVEVTIKW